jgi:(p)ppGpp synthase/HD superfamily hydrolase
MTDLTHRFSDAFSYAAEQHNGQLRKGTDIPYISHVMAVAALALENGADEDEAIAALLHDVVEDCGGEPRLREIRERYGERVAEIVMGCTDAIVIPKPEWVERKRKYVKELPSANDSVLLVVACDKLHNVRSVILALHTAGERAWDRFKGGREGTLWYYRAVLAVLVSRGFRPTLVEELRIAIEELHRLARSAIPITDDRFPDA